MWWNSGHTAAAAITVRTYATHSSSGNSLQSTNTVRPNTAVECGCRVCATALSSTQLHSCRTITTSPNLTSFSSPRNSIPPLGLLRSSTDLQTSYGYVSWFVPGLPKLIFHKQFCSWNLAPSNKSLHVTHPFISTLVLPSRLYSRLLQNAANRKPGRRIRVDSLLLIDENGSNLGVMDRETALQLADSKGVQIIQVRKETPESEAVFRLVSRKQLWEDEKRKKEAQRKDPRSVTKEITVSVKIAEHDLAVKVNHMREFLEKKHSVKLWVKTKVRRQEYLAAERKKQLKMLEGVAKSLEDVAVREAEQNHHRNRLVCTFRPL